MSRRAGPGARARERRRQDRQAPVAGTPAGPGAAARAFPAARRLPALAALALLLALAFGVGIWRTDAHSRERAGQPPAAAAPTSPAFSGDRALELLKQQVAFGPRVPNLKSHVACREFMVKTLKECTPDVTVQEFKRTFPPLRSVSPLYDGEPLNMANVIGRFAGPGKNGVLLCAHWDTRPTADMEADPARRARPIPGANDGASGVAILLELARTLKAKPPPVPVWIVFFDGEDYGPGLDRMFLGARYFADNLPPDTPREGVLLDMVGDRDLVIPQEPNSMRFAPETVRAIWGAAARLGYERQFPLRVGPEIEDDHLPLNQKGLKVIDLIDFEYPPWHTLGDDPGQCSARSLKVVGDVLDAWIRSRK